HAHSSDRRDGRPTLRGNQHLRAPNRVNAPHSATVLVVKGEPRTLNPPSEYLLATRDLVAYRLRGRPRDRQDGKPKAVGIFAGPTTTPAALARLLRNAAQALDPAR